MSWWKLIFIMFIVTIFNPSDSCLLKGEQGTLPVCLLWPHYRGAMFQELKPCCTRSQSHGRLWPLLKLKFGNCWLTSKCCGSSCKKFNTGFQFQFQSLQFQFHFQFRQFQFQFQFRNWIDPNAATCPHNTTHIPSCYNNEQTTKQTKAINNSYIYTHLM